MQKTNQSLELKSNEQEQDSHSSNKIKVELDLFNYGTKSDVKKVTGVDTSKFSKNLVNLKSEVNKLDADKLKVVLIDLKALSNIAEEMLLIETVYDLLFTKFNAVDPSKLV